MNIGIFDSGLGGLLITKSLVDKLPEYNYVYFGDTKRVPYGNRSHDTIYEFLKEGVDLLFQNNCKLVIVACNTASAHALRKIQQEFLPQFYPDRKVLGVIIPTCEEALDVKKVSRIGVIATQATVSSKAFVDEIRKINKQINKHAKIIQKATPLLVPFVESDSIRFVEPILREYLKPFKNKIDVLILGCTHYPILKRQIAKILGKKIKIISQDKVIPKKLKNYLSRHPEIENVIGRNSTCRFLVSDLTKTVQKTARKWFGNGIEIEEVSV